MSPVLSSEKRRGRRRAPTAERFFHHLFASMRCGIITIDRTGRITHLNGLARKILEIPEADPIGRLCSEALADHPLLVNLFVESFRMKNQPNRAEMEIRLQDRKKRTIGFSMPLIRDEAGEVLGAAIFFRDLTQIEHQEEQAKLKDRLAALGQMAAGMAHEIRNPLGGIEVTASLLRRRLASRTEDVSLADKILSEVKRLNRTVMDCLEYVKPLHLDRKRSSLEAVTHEALRRASTSMEGKAIEITVKMERDLPPIWIDPDRVRDALINLVRNAYEAIPKSGNVRVEVCREPLPYSLTTEERDGDCPPVRGSFDSHAVIRITDNGKGIPEEMRDRLFYPFFTTKQTGSGVGLPLARKIVEGHQGILDFESEVGRGTTFVVKLPLVTRPADDASPRILPEKTSP